MRKSPKNELSFFLNGAFQRFCHKGELWTSFALRFEGTDSTKTLYAQVLSYAFTNLTQNKYN